MSTPTLTFLLMDAPYENARSTTALRLVDAALQVLAAVGERYGIGTPSLRAARHDKGIPPLDHVFDRRHYQPASDGHTLALVNRAWDALPTGGLLAVARRTRSVREMELRQQVTDRLGATEVPDQPPGRMVVWTAPTWPQPS